MRVSEKPGAAERWERRFRARQVSPLKGLVRFLLRLPLFAGQFIVALAIALLVLLIAVLDHSIRRFLEACELSLFGMVLTGSGYSIIGVPMTGLSAFVFVYFIFKWSREDEPVSNAEMKFSGEVIGESNLS